MAIVNVHLESAQSEAGAERRARQLDSALKRASKLCARQQEHDSHTTTRIPWIVCGDFNTGADSFLFHSLRGQESSWHGGPSLASVYEHADTAQTLPVNRATYAEPHHHYVIDHVLYSHNSLQLDCALNALTPHEIAKHLGPRGTIDQGFPTAFLPSDHIPVGAMFSWSDRVELDCTPASESIQDDHQVSSESRASSNTTALFEEGRPVSSDRLAELQSEWDQLQSEKPRRVRGKPSPDQIAERRAYASTVKAWWHRVVQESTHRGEVDFVHHLLKETKLTK